jgi:hypothetical protein
VRVLVETVEAQALMEFASMRSGPASNQRVCFSTGGIGIRS